LKTHFLKLALSSQNVLEGIGLLVKKGKNHVSWNDNAPEPAVADETKSKEKTGDDTDEIGSPPRINKTTSVTSNAQFEEMKKHLQNLKQEEREVDQYLEYLTQQAEVFNGRQPASREQAACLPPGVGNVADHMYVRFKDITAMPEYSSDTVIGIRAPSGTSLEVPDPDQGMTPGQRRFEMYLSSKGSEGAAGEPATGKGDPINVYLVRPRAEDQAKQGPDGRQQGSFVQQTTPPAQRGPPQVPQSEPEPELKPSRDIKVEQSRQPPPEFGPPQPSQRPGEPPYGYGMPPAHRGGEWGHGQSRPPYPPQDNRGPYRKEHGPPPQHGAPPGYAGGPPPGYGPPPHHQYQDPAWRSPPPGYGGPPPRGAYLPPSSRQQYNEPSHPSGYQPQQLPKADRGERAESQSSPDRTRDGGRYSSSRHFAPSRDGPQPGGPRDRNASPFRPRSDHFQPPRETGRSGPSGDTPPSHDSSVAYHPPTPVRDQQHLLSMPLSSPQGSFGMPSSFFPSQYGSPPPGGQRADVRAGDVQFPMPPLSGRESNRGGDYRELPRWNPPRPQMSSSRPGPDGEPPRSNIAPRSRR
jgi:hypothetical protein